MDLVKLGLSIAGGFYVLSPFDAIPEAVTGPLGLVDDAVVGYYSFKWFFEGIGRSDIPEEVS
jgi:uncharacterized membrane protein YkvA (DUF1232 family)